MVLYYVLKTQTCKTKDFADKPVKHKKPFNSNVCFLCGMEGHYGSSTSCYAAKKVRKNILIKI